MGGRGGCTISGSLRAIAWSRTRRDAPSGNEVNRSTQPFSESACDSGTLLT